MNKEEKNESLTQFQKEQLLACENDLIESINKVFYETLKTMGENETTLNVILLQYYNVDTRDKCIASIANTNIEARHLDKVYDRILKKVYEKYKNHLKYEEKRKIEEKDQKAYNRQVVVVIVCCLIFGIFIAPLIVEHPFIFMLICFIGSIIVSIINAIYIYFKKNLGD